jgi:ribosome recycling factor
MSESLEELFLFGEEKMEKAITQLHREFAAVRSNRANPLILDRVLVEYYGVPTPLRQMSQVTVQDGTTLVISPYDKSILKDIEKIQVNGIKDWSTIKNRIKDTVHDFVYSKTRRNPMVIPIISEV